MRDGTELFEKLEKIVDDYQNNEDLLAEYEKRWDEFSKVGKPEQPKAFMGAESYDLWLKVSGEYETTERIIRGMLTDLRNRRASLRLVISNTIPVYTWFKVGDVWVRCDYRDGYSHIEIVDELPEELDDGRERAV
jgi:hypothetical protein